MGKTAIVVSYYHNHQAFKTLIIALNLQTLKDFDLFVYNAINGVVPNTIIEASIDRTIGYNCYLEQNKLKTYDGEDQNMLNWIKSGRYNQVKYNNYFILNEGQIPQIDWFRQAAINGSFEPMF